MNAAHMPQRQSPNQPPNANCMLPPTVSLLLEERKLIHERDAQTLGMMFNFLAVVVTPMCTLFAYTLISANPNSKYAFLFAPFFLIIACMVMASLYLHEVIAGYYGRDLARKINTCLQNENMPPLLLEKVDYQFLAQGFGVQRGFLIIAGTLMVAAFLLILPLVGRIMQTLPDSRVISPTHLPGFILAYWLLLTFVAVVGFLACTSQFGRKLQKLHTAIRFEEWQA